MKTLYIILSPILFAVYLLRLFLKKTLPGAIILIMIVCCIFPAILISLLMLIIGVTDLPDEFKSGDTLKGLCVLLAMLSLLLAPVGYGILSIIDDLIDKLYDNVQKYVFKSIEFNFESE